MTRPPRGRYLALSSVTALGVVFGDIGTSPLYALRECFAGEHGVAVSPPNVLGVLSLILWSLVLVISVKYLAYVMRADNHGEGGVLALMALASSRIRPGRLLVALGMLGTALLYGDGAITPAISVLSAMEGLEVLDPGFAPFVAPISIAILAGLFWFQRHGTTRVGLVFGPVMLLWFAALAALGVYQIAHGPGVLRAASPSYAVDYFGRHGLAGAVVLGAVFLVVTGAEDLYADMGHFGKRPIRVAWYAVVLPSLVLNYFGQGALVLAHPEAATAPLFHMGPAWMLVPLLALATLATVIASQAVFSGAYSITRQAILLGYAPRVAIEHTSPRTEGEVYLPSVNLGVFAGAVLLVIVFGSSTGLAAAYGITVAAAMAVTTLLAYVVARRVWGWSPALALAVTAPLIGIDLVFIVATGQKMGTGGWLPVLLSMIAFAVMSTWKRGRDLLAARLDRRSLPWERLGGWLADRQPARVGGTAVYLVGKPDRVPPALVENVRLNGTLHERVVFLSVVFTHDARVPVAERLHVERLDGELLRMQGRYGFLEQPDVPRLLDLALLEGVDIDPAQTIFVLGRETLLASRRGGMALWRERLFRFLSRNTARAAAFFGIPSDRVLEIGSQIEL